MFGKNKDKETSNSNPSSASGGNAQDANNISAPPLKPFSKKGSHSAGKNTTAPFRPEIPRRVMDIPGGPSRNDHMLSLDDDANRLTVGRNICLNGEITACDKLVVEGRVEATLSDAHTIEVSPTGYFKGDADVMVAEISGRFEGTLVAKDLLTIRNDGKIEGSVRYGRIVIEAGGEISGDMASLEEAAEGLEAAQNDSSVADSTN